MQVGLIIEYLWQIKWNCQVVDILDSETYYQKIQ